MKYNFKFVALIFANLLIFLLIGCSINSEPGEEIGTYYFVYEKGLTYTKTESDNCFILDGKGGGQYQKDEYTHNIKYTYEKPDIVIEDKLTGIKYKGTLSDGKLLVLDGKEGADTTSEFLFQTQYAK